MDDKTCRELLPAYLEGGLTDAERASVEAHLERSATCRERLAELEGLDTLLAGLPREVDVPTDLTERILAATLGEAGGHHDHSRSDGADAASLAEDADAARSAAATEKRPTSIGRAGGQAPARTAPPRIATRPARDREDRKRGRTVALRWATAAAVLITLVVGWALTRSAGDEGGDGIPPGVDSPTRVVLAAKMFTARNGVGRPPADARYRVYGPKVAKVFHDLTVMGIVPALSWQNLSLVGDAPFIEARTDADGRLVVDRGLDTLNGNQDGNQGDGSGTGWAGAHLVSVEKAGRVGAWGLIDLVELDADGKPVGGALPRQEIVLLPATDRRMRGTVIDAVSQRPIAGAVIATPDGTGTAKTDGSGAFDGVAHLAGGRSASFYAFADGYAPARVSAGKMASGDVVFALERRAASRDVDIAVVDANGKPLARALVLATPQVDGSEAWRGLPRSERSRPEVGVTDERGRVTLRGLYAGRYDVAVHHAYGVSRGREMDVAAVGATPVRVDVKPDGDGTLDVIVETADGEALQDANVFLTRTDDGNTMTRLISRHLDLDGGTRFRRLGGGAHVVRIFTRDGFGFYVTVELDRSDRAEMRYVLPEGLHRIEGRIHDDLVGGIATVRIEGERPRERFGRRRARSHNFAVEVPVEKDGTFVTPALPSLKNVTFGGRSVDVTGTVYKLSPTTPLADALRARTPATHRITLR